MKKILWFSVIALFVSSLQAQDSPGIKKHLFGLQGGTYSFSADSRWGVFNGFTYDYAINNHITIGLITQNAFAEHIKDTVLPPDFDSRMAGGLTCGGSLYGLDSPFDLTFQTGLLYGRTVRVRMNDWVPPYYNVTKTQGVVALIGVGGVYRHKDWSFGVNNQSTFDMITQDIRTAWVFNVQRKF